MTNQISPILTLGPVLYNWPAETWRDFYLKIADEAAVEKVYLGEVICSKRAPLFDPHLEQVVTRLENGGKEVIFSTLSETTSNIDRKLMKKIAASEGFNIEANDVSALWHIKGRPHTIGPHMNAYNEESMKFFTTNGATNICLPPEMPAVGMKNLGKLAGEIGVDLEVQVYGRIGLALSARCYHARTWDRTKDSCKFICDIDCDGMDLHTLEGKPFLTINGIQTQSYTCLNLINELDEIIACGVTGLRISPHSTGTLETIEAFDGVLNKKLSAEEAAVKLEASRINAPFSNGFYYQKPGFEWISNGSHD
ncbi:MAG: U32 family peptidase [Hyphomicrobiales bacterium]|nr:U32 family peptidase [Hyphomicrobiales bacterium]